MVFPLREHGAATGSDSSGLPHLDHQQAVMLDGLRRAAGGPVSFDELREAGVEFPASVVSELELAGVALERCYAGAGGHGRIVGVRLDPARDPGREPDVSADPGAPGPTESIRIYRSSAIPALAAGLLALPSDLSSSVRRRRGPDRVAPARLMAPVALLLGAVGLAALVAVAVSGGTRQRQPTLANRPRHVLAAARPKTPSTHRTVAASRSAAQASPQQAAPTPVSPPLASALETRGHDLLLSGLYRDAVPVLDRAVAATGERPGACAQPASEVCLTYAYALYDLGRALQLSGEPSAAVTVLERRLQIDNQRPVVAAELAVARQQAS